MGVHLGAAWAQAGMDVTLCSRDVNKAQPIVDALLAGQGWTGDKCAVPPNKPDGPEGAIQPTDWTLKAGSIKDAADADVIALASPFHVMWGTLRQIQDDIKGKDPQPTS